MEDILVPIFICAVMPVAIVLIVFLASMNSENKRSKILIKAIETNNGIDADKLAATLGKQKKTPRELLNSRLLYGCIFTLIGVLLCVLTIIACAGGESIPEGEFATNCLLFGGISLALGISYLVVYLVTRKHVDDTDGNRE